jgi:glycerophosphoryl diester phosphodiesterase
MEALVLSSLLLTGFLSCEKMGNNPLVIGHRGAMGHETENTLASVRKALDLGVDMIEIDVFKIESGEIAVFHDERLERLTNGGGHIEEYNILDLKMLTLEGNHKIPQLQDVLKEIDHQVRLNIELKGGNTADRVNFIVNSYIKNNGWAMEDFLISSFKWEELKEMRSLNKEIPIAILTDGDPLGALSIAQELKAEAINPRFKSLNAANVATMQEAGFKVYTWTVNEPGDIEQMKAIGVDGIITNYPERVR